MKKIVYIVIFAGMTLLALYCFRPGTFRNGFSVRGKHAIQAFPRFRTEDVARIEIRWKEIASTLIRKEGKWFLTQRGLLPASENRIHNLLSALSSVSPVKEVRNSSAELLEELHLTEKPTDPKKVPGVRVILKNNAGKELFNILLGKGHFLRPDSNGTSSTNAEGRYVLTNGKISLIPLVFEECHPVPAAWVEPLRLRELQRSLYMAAWKIPAGQTKAQLLFQVFRRSTAHPFTLMQPKGKKADNALLSGLAAELSKPFTGDYFTGNIAALAGKESIFLLIRTSDGFQYRLQLTEYNDQTDVVSLAVKYDPAKVPGIPGETRKAFEERKKALAKRFEEEKFYAEGKLFLTGKRLKELLLIPPFKAAALTSNTPVKAKKTPVPAAAVKAEQSSAR